VSISAWEEITQTLKKTNTRLLAVSKYSSDAAVQCLLDAGQIDFAESRPQNLRDRALMFPQATWHFIGPLQKNKAKYVGRYAAMWHSLVDVETAQAVASHVEDKILPVLIQVNVSSEAQKQGVLPENVEALFDAVAAIPQLQVVGLMGMAAKDGDVRGAFKYLRTLRDDLQLKCGTVRELSMGMSGDWQEAVEEGATMVRLGTIIFEDLP